MSVDKLRSFLSYELDFVRSAREAVVDGSKPRLDSIDVLCQRKAQLLAVELKRRST